MVWRARTSPARSDTRDFLAARRGRQRGWSVVSRQYFEQLDLEVQIRIGRNMRADLALAIAQLRRHEQPALAADPHAHQPDVPTFCYIGISVFND